MYVYSCHAELPALTIQNVTHSAQATRCAKHFRSIIMCNNVQELSVLLDNPEEIARST